MSIKILTLCLILICPAIPLQMAASPSSDEVKKELARVLGMKQPVKSSHSSSDGLLDWLSNPIVLVIIVVILAFLIYLALRNVSPYYRKEHSQRAKQAKGKPVKRRLSNVEALYEQALVLSQEGRLNEATQYLHKAAYEDLRNKQIIHRNTEYTNNDVKRLIQSMNIYQPFCSIALWAEIAGFSEKDVGSDDFASISQSFEHAFLGR